MRILLIEDDVQTATALASALGSAGHDVRIAPDGPAGLAVVEAVAPDVVLLDLGLPSMDGYEVARRLRAQPLIRRPAIIAVTGYLEEDERKHSYEVGIDFHFTKPVDPGFLGDMLARLQRVQADSPP